MAACEERVAVYQLSDLALRKPVDHQILAASKSQTIVCNLTCLNQIRPGLIRSAGALGSTRVSHIPSPFSFRHRDLLYIALAGQSRLFTSLLAIPLCCRRHRLGVETR